MDERERRTDLRRRAIVTLAMVAAGMALLPEQREPGQGRGPAAMRPDLARKAAAPPEPGLSLARMKAGSRASGQVRPRAAALRQNK